MKCSKNTRVNHADNSPLQHLLFPKLPLNTRFVVFTRNNLFYSALIVFLKQKLKYNTCVKGYVR